MSSKVAIPFSILPSTEWNTSYIFFFYICMSNSSSIICGKDFISPLNCLCSFAKDQWLYLYGSILGYLFCSLILVSIVLPIPFYLHYCSSIVSLEIRQRESSNFVLLQYSVGSSSSFVFQVNFLYVWSVLKSMKWLAEIWLGLCWIFRSSWEELTS